jgi:hypothetical protein
MRYFVVADSCTDYPKEDQRLRIRLGLAASDDEVVLRQKADKNPSDNVDEDNFADVLESAQKTAKPITAVKPDSDEQHAANDKAENEKKAANGRKPAAPEHATIIAIGGGAGFALDTLAQLAKRSSIRLADHSYKPFVQFILVAPCLPATVFSGNADALAAGTLASRVCSRIVVLHSDGGSPSAALGERAAELGTWGPSGTTQSNVLSLDVSALLLTHLPGCGAYLQSLEILGLIGRAAGGASGQALQRFAMRGHRDKE